MEPEAYTDHHLFTGEEVRFSDLLTVVCTEKDATKLVQLDVDLSNVWSLDIDVVFDDDLASALAAKLAECGVAPMVPMVPSIEEQNTLAVPQEAGV